MLGSLVGSMLGNRFRNLAPEPIIVAVLAARRGDEPADRDVLLDRHRAGGRAVAALGQQLGKLAMDAQIQRDVPERVRTSAFARTETAVQLAWVLGGGLGIALPLNPVLGFTRRRRRAAGDVAGDRPQLRRPGPGRSYEPAAPECPCTSPAQPDAERNDHVC